MAVRLAMDAWLRNGCVATVVCVAGYGGIAGYGCVAGYGCMAKPAVREKSGSGPKRDYREMIGDDTCDDIARDNEADYA